MKLNTTWKDKFQKGVYITLIPAIIFDFIIWNIHGSLSKSVLLTPVVLIGVLYLLYRGNSSFKYDIDGEVLNFTTENPVFPGWPMFTTHFEFPKRKLLEYRVVEMPLKKMLFVSIKSKQGVVKRRVSISYLSENKLKALRTSLHKVVAQNKNKVKHERGAIS